MLNQDFILPWRGVPYQCLLYQYSKGKPSQIRSWTWALLNHRVDIGTHRNWEASLLLLRGLDLTLMVFLAAFVNKKHWRGIKPHGYVYEIDQL